jgi:hypothetical protein
MTTSEGTPVADALARAIQQRQDGFVSPGGGGLDQLLCEGGIHLPWKVSWNTSAQFSGFATPGSITARHAMGLVPACRTGRNRIRPLDPASHALLGILLDAVSEERGQDTQLMIDGPGLPMDRWRRFSRAEIDLTQPLWIDRTSSSFALCTKEGHVGFYRLRGHLVDRSAYRVKPAEEVSKAAGIRAKRVGRSSTLRQMEEKLINGWHRHAVRSHDQNET